MMDASTLISSTSHVSSEDEEELEEHLKTFPYGLGELLKILIEHLGDEIDFSVVHPQLGVKGRILGEGLNQIVKTAAKYISL